MTGATWRSVTTSTSKRPSRIATFVDSSALYALLDAGDPAHLPARGCFADLIAGDEQLATHNYVLVETTALAQRRHGLDAVGVLRDAFVPVLHVTWVDRQLHDQAIAATIAGRTRGVSLVDRVSFHVMHRRGITRAFAFDEDFARQGFETVPGLSPPR